MNHLRRRERRRSIEDSIDLRRQQEENDYLQRVRVFFIRLFEYIYMF